MRVRAHYHKAASLTDKGWFSLLAREGSCPETFGRLRYSGYWVLYLGTDSAWSHSVALVSVDVVKIFLLAQD